MTNKEAIKGLKALSKEFSGYKPNEEMFDMAIKALELETINSDSNEIKVTNCNYKDTIYRQAAIDAVSDCGICIQRIVDLPSAQLEQRWIPCSERLPEHGGRYLISVLDGINRRTTVAPYLPRCKAWAMNGRMAYRKVIAWMPLPEPAKLGGD